MDENGKIADYLVLDIYQPNLLTGMNEFAWFEVWAEPNAQNMFAAIPGIVAVQSFHTRYNLALDKRYDVQFVHAAIEHTLHCASTGDLDYAYSIPVPNFQGG